MSKVVYSKTKNEDEEVVSPLPEKEHSQIEYLKTKLKQVQKQRKECENEMKVLRSENDKLRQINNDYVKQLNQMSQDRFKKIEKIVVQQSFFEQRNIETQIKEFIKKLTSNFSFLEREHAKLIDHCRVMENDLNYYKERVGEAELINENLRNTGKSSIDEVMEDLRQLKNSVDVLNNENAKLQFDLAVKQNELDRITMQLDQSFNNQQELEQQINDLKIKHNRMLNEHDEKFNKDAKFIYQMKLKSDFLEYERRLAYQDAMAANVEKNSQLMHYVNRKTRQMENELDILRSTTDNFLKTNKHIFNLSELPKMKLK